MPTIDELRRASGAYAQGRSDIELIDEYARLNKLSPLDAVRELNYTPLQSDNGKWGNRLGASIDSYQANWSGLGEALFGSQGLKRRRVENEFEAAVAREAAANQGAISSYKDVGGVGDALDYVGGLALDSLPYLGEAALGGIAARGLSTGLRTAATAGRAADASVDAVRAGHAAQRALGTRMALGGAVASYPSAVGDILSNQRAANPDGPVDLTSAAIGGVPYAALNMLGVEGMVARGGLGRGLSSLDDAARLGKTKRFGAAVGMGSAVEGASETGQEVINQYFGRMAVNPNEELFSPDAVDRYGESFVGGAALGGTFSGLGGWRKSQDYQNNQELQAAILRETRLRAQQQDQQQQGPTDLLRIGYEQPTVYVNPAAGADTNLDAATLRFNDGLDNAPRAVGGLPVTAPVRYNAQTEMFGEQSSAPGAEPVESVEELQLRRQELDRELNALQNMYAQAESEFQQTGDQAKWFRSRAILMSHLEKLAPVKQELDARLDSVSINTPDTGVPTGQGRFLFDDPITSWQTTDTTEAVPEADKRDARAAAPDYFKGPKAGGRAKTLNAIIGDADPEGVATRIAERWAAASKDETKRELADNLAAWYSAFTGKSLVKEAPANVSVPDVSGLGAGVSSVAGGPVNSGSLAAAGPVLAPADGVSGTAAVVPADTAQATAGGNDVRGAGTAPLTEKPAKPPKAPSSGDGKLADRVKGQSVVIGGAVDFKAMKLLLEPLSPKMHQAVRFALGVDKDGDRLDKPMSTPEAAAQMGVSRAELSRVLTAIGLDKKTRDRFFASSAAANERAEGVEDEAGGNTTDVRNNDEESDMVDGDRDAGDTSSGVIASAGGSQSNIAAAPKKSFSKMAAYLAVKDKAPADVSDAALAEAVAEGSRYMSIAANPNDKTGERARLDEAKKLLAPLLAEAARRQRSPSFQRAVAAAWERANPDSAKADDEAKPAEKDEDADQEADATDQPQAEAPEAAPAPKVVTKKKKTIVKPDSDGPSIAPSKFSATVGQGAGSTVAKVKEVVAKLFPDMVNDGVYDDHVKVHADETAAYRYFDGELSIDEIRGSAGFVDPFDSRIVHIVASNVAEADIAGVLIHEIGVHVGLTAELGARFKVLEAQVKSWASAPEGSMERQVYERAAARVAAARLAGKADASTVAEELVAYAAEEAVSLGATLDKNAESVLTKWLRQLAQVFRAAAKTLLGAPDLSTIPSITPQQLVTFAYGAARAHMRTPMFEKGALESATGEDIARFYLRGKAERNAAISDPEPGDLPGEEVFARPSSRYGSHTGLVTMAVTRTADQLVEDGRGDGSERDGPAGFHELLVTVSSAQSLEIAKKTGNDADAAIQTWSLVYAPDEFGPAWALTVWGPAENSELYRVLAARGEASMTKEGWTRLENVRYRHTMDMQAEVRRRLTRALGGEIPRVVSERATGARAATDDTPGRKGDFPPAKVKLFSAARAAPTPPSHVTGTQPLPKVEQMIRTLPAALRPSARAVAQLLRSAGRKVLNTAAFTDDLLDRAASMGIKSAEKYKKLARERAASIGHQERMVLDAVTGFNELDASLKGKDGPVNQYLWKTTTREAWGFQPDWLTEQVTIDKEMKAAFDALPAPAQKVVKDMLRHGHETLKAKKQLVQDMMVSEYDALIAAETDPEAKKALEADKAKAVKSSYGSLMRLADNKPYAPIKRFGSHVVIAKSQAYIDAEANLDQKLMRELESQEEHYYVDFVEGEIAASALEDQLRAKPGYAFTQYREIEEQRNDLYGGSKTLKAIGDLKAKIDGLPSSAERKQLATMLQEMYLLQLGEDTARKSELRRRKIAGDIDMIRSFETQGLADARFMGQIQYGQPMLETMNDMRREVKDSKVGDPNAKSEVFNELIKRHLQAMEYEPTPIVNALTRMSSMWFLATSPSYYLQNSTQPWMMSLPYMAAKHDYGKMASLLSKAYGDVWGPLKDAKMFGQLDFKALLADENKSLTDGEKAMIRSLLDADRIDIGMANEIGQITAEVEARSVKGAYAKVDNSLRGLQQKLEAVNRLTSALAAYRAETSAGSSEAEATAYADDVIQRTHGDYSSWNAPRAFNTRGGKIMLQFRKYQLIQLTMMAKLFNNSFGEAKTPEEKAQKIVARKALRNMMAQAFVVGGGKALPAGGLIAYVFSKLFGEDDEPPETTFRKMVGNEDIADMLLYGSLAVAGINGAPYGGWGNSTSILPFVDLDLSSRKGVTEAGYALLTGPFGGLTLRAADGIGYIQNGDYWRGLENLLPKGFTNFSKAIREGSEGTTNRRGDQLLTPEEVSYWNGFQQSLGVTPLSSAKRMVASDALYNTRTEVKEEGARIKKDFLEARKDRDTAAMADARKKWAEYQNKRVRLGFDRQSLSELMKAADQQRTRESLSRGGIQYRKGEEGFAEGLAVGEE